MQHFWIKSNILKYKYIMSIFSLLCLYIPSILSRFEHAFHQIPIFQWNHLVHPIVRSAWIFTGDCWQYLYVKQSQAKNVSYFFCAFLDVDLEEHVHTQDKYHRNTPFHPFQLAGTLHRHHVLTVEEMVNLYFFVEDNFGNMGRISCNK